MGGYELAFTDAALQAEHQRILGFIEEQIGPDGKVVLGLSGGIDSEVTARLIAEVIGPERMKCYTVLQDNFEPKYLSNARELARELGCELIELALGGIPRQVISEMAKADQAIDFRPDGLLDVGRTKVALRTMIYSAYMERGYLSAGPGNRTELELGYYLPFGDGLAHFAPIVHLYKTQVQQLARLLRVQERVLGQAPSAGFWEGDTDLEGIAYWLYNCGPIQVELDLDETQEQEVHQIHQELSFRAIDTALSLFNRGTSYETIAEESGLSSATVFRLEQLRTAARVTKNRPLGMRLAAD